MATDRAFRDQPRLAAYDVLRAVSADDAYANLVLPQVLRDRGLGGRDAALATELVGGTLRGQGTYDAILAECTDRPLGKVEAKVLDALRLGTHQLLAMRVPGHAAVATTVDLVRHRVGHRPAGFVNAILRKVSAHDLDGWVRRVAPDPTGHLAVATSHPRWVVEALATALGRPGELDALLAADNERPRVTLVARPGLSTVAELGGRPTLSPLGVTLKASLFPLCSTVWGRSVSSRGALPVSCLPSPSPLPDLYGRRERRPSGGLGSVWFRF